MFDGGAENAWGFFLFGQGIEGHAVDSLVVGFGSAAGEDDLIGVDLESVSKKLAGFSNGARGSLTHCVRRGGVSVLIEGKAIHQLGGGLTTRSCRGVIKEEVGAGGLHDWHGLEP